MGKVHYLNSHLQKFKENKISFELDELENIAVRQEELKALIKAQSKEVRPLIHPAMGQRYKKAVHELRLFLKDGQGSQAKEHVRALIEKIVLTPKQGKKELSIDLYGDLAGILKLASKGVFMNAAGLETRKLEKKAVNDNFLFEPSVQLVAGGGFEPPTFGL